MSGAPYLSSDRKRYPSRPPGRVPGKRKPSRGRRPPNSWSVAGNKVKKFPSGQGNPSSLSRDKLQREKSPSLPVELQAMLLIQRGSAAIAASLVVATLAVYGVLGAVR